MRRQRQRARPPREPRERRNGRQRVRIHAIAAGGEAVGRLADGRAVFVRGAAPDELCEIEIIQDRKRWARGKLLEVLEPGPDRREPPCPFAGRCGGCPLEHLEYPAQLRSKAAIVRDALVRLGGVDTDAPPVIPSPREFRYRNRVSFTLERGPGSRVVAGFHAADAPDRIVDVDGRCLLPEEPISVAWDGLRRSWGPGAELLPDAPRLRLTLRATAAGAVSLLVEGGEDDGEPEELLTAVPSLRSVWAASPGDAPRLLAGAPTLPETWGPETVELGGAAFLQVNREAAAALERHVIEQSGDVGGRRVLDAYCGVGLHARSLARLGARVVGIELDPAAVEAARAAAPEGADFRLGRVEEVLAELLPADLVILNPPRAGVAEEVAAALADDPPARLVYISCDPATLARDIGRMSRSLELTALTAFDLFPQTAHVETVATLARRN